MTTTPTQQLSDAGVSIWLDDLSRERLTSGSLEALIKEKNVVGVTTNPSIFHAALSDGESYAAQVAELAAPGFVEKFGDDRGARNRGVPFGDQHRRGAGRVSTRKSSRRSHTRSSTGRASRLCSASARRMKRECGQNG